MTGQELKKLCEELERAFPTRAKLAKFVLIAFNENLEAIASANADLSEAVFALVAWAEAKGKLDQLVAAFEAEHPIASPGKPGAPEVEIARLPHTGADLFGRESELVWLDEAWNQGANVASIVAWGGVGKSCLVNAWLRRVQAGGWRGAERVYGWSFYSQGTTDRITSADDFINTALHGFGDKDPTRGSAWDKGERLARLVRRQKTLLVLDGLEPLQWGAGPEEGKIKDPALQALLRELAAENKGMCVVTSRVALADVEDWADKSPRLDLAQLSPKAGAALLRKKGVVGLDSELVKAAEDYKGHALALALLGAYLGEAYEGDIRKRGEIKPLEDESRHGAHARRVMAAYERLFENGPEAGILKMLGLFDRPADPGEIGVLRAEPVIVGLTEGVSGVREPVWNKALARLRRAGLLVPNEPNDKRLDAHPLVREHFGEQVKSKSPEAWREGHRRLYEHLKSTAKALPDNVDEMQPLYAAVVHGCWAGKHQEALDEVYWERIQRGKEKFNWRKLGAFGSQLEVLSAFFDPPWEKLAPGLTETAQSFVLSSAGFALGALGRLAEAVSLMCLALTMVVDQRDWESAAIYTNNLSELFLTLGNVDEAVSVGRQGVELAGKSDDASQRMINTTTLADALRQAGRLAEAATLFREAEQMQKDQQPNYPRLYSVQGFQYCDLLLDQGQASEVLDRAVQTLEWFNDRYPILSSALDHLSLGRAHLHIAQTSGSELTQAAKHLGLAVEGLRNAGAQHHLPLGHLARAELHLHKRDFASAQRDLDEAMRIATRSGMLLHQTDAHLGFARYHLALGQPHEAKPHLDKARALIAKTGYHRRDAALQALSQELDARLARESSAGG